MTCGAASCGYCAMGSVGNADGAGRTITAAKTLARIGRRMKRSTNMGRSRGVGACAVGSDRIGRRWRASARPTPRRARRLEAARHDDVVADDRPERDEALLGDEAAVAVLRDEDERLAVDAHDREHGHGEPVDRSSTRCARGRTARRARRPAAASWPLTSTDCVWSSTRGETKKITRVGQRPALAVHDAHRQAQPAGRAPARAAPARPLRAAGCDRSR